MAPRVPLNDRTLSPALILLARALRSRPAAAYVVRFVDRIHPARGIGLNALSLRALRAAAPVLQQHGGNPVACLRAPDCPPCLVEAFEVPDAALRRAESTAELLLLVNNNRCREWRLPAPKRSCTPKWMYGTVRTPR